MGGLVEVLVCLFFVYLSLICDNVRVIIYKWEGGGGFVLEFFLGFGLVFCFSINIRCGERY